MAVTLNKFNDVDMICMLEEIEYTIVCIFLCISGTLPTSRSDLHLLLSHKVIHAHYFLILLTSFLSHCSRSTSFHEYHLSFTLSYE